MRGPLSEIPEQTMLTCSLGAKFENLLFPEEFKGKRDVHASVFVTLDDFENFGRATHADYPIREGKEHAEGCFGVEALADHSPIARLENVQGKLFAGEKYDVKREERNAFRPHGSHGE